jgi:hypothetical protein
MIFNFTVGLKLSKKAFGVTAPKALYTATSVSFRINNANGVQGPS